MDAIQLIVRRLHLTTRGDRGAVAAEYALVLTLIALVIVVAVTFFGFTLLGLFEQGPETFPS